MRAFSFVSKRFAESDSPIVKNRQNSPIIGLFIFLNFAEQVVVFEESRQFHENNLPFFETCAILSLLRSFHERR